MRRRDSALAGPRGWTVLRLPMTERVTSTAGTVPRIRFGSRQGHP